MLHKTILITGTTSGIGTETALALANEGHTIYMLVRDVRKGEDLKQRLIAETKNKKIHVVECDLADMESVCRAADEIKSKLVNVQILINNAGGMFKTREVSKDGFEMTFVTNHLGHFLLTNKLMPLLEKGQARIINVSSDMYKSAKINFTDLQLENGYSSLRAYANTKLMNIYFTKSLAERCISKGIMAYSLHPGVVKTNFGENATGLFKFLLIISRLFMVSAKTGAQTSVYLATEPKIERLTGKYFKGVYTFDTSAKANDNSSRHKLWNQSEKLVEKYTKTTV